MTNVRINLTVNGERHEAEVEPRLALADFLRNELRLTGTHLGCEHGVCGSCTVIVDGAPARSCLLLCAQLDGSEVETVESLASDSGELNELQRAFSEEHALQCGFCTPGLLMTATSLLRENPTPTEEEARAAVAGNLCRCTGYAGIVAAIVRAGSER
jgi:aerobic-type carbon monoxide dehydrogenase small subunit (CoxS/CutS family)